MKILGAPSRYLQGAGAFNLIDSELSRFDLPILVIIDPVAQSLLGQSVDALLPQARQFVFGGECTRAEINAAAALVERKTLIVGIGGGKTVDTAKGVAALRDCPVAIVPTIASNDSPTSHIAVVYNEDHSIDGVVHMAANPGLVLVDTQIIARAPRRFLVSGIGDALSKKYEVAAAKTAGGLNFFGGAPTELTHTIAEHCHRILLSDSHAALAALTAQTPNEALERVVEAAILLSGLAFESGGLSIAHSMVRGFAKMPELSDLLHGEMVGLGTLVQLKAGQGSSEETAELKRFMKDLGLPVSLTRFGITHRDQFLEIASIALSAPYARNFYVPLTVEHLANAMQELDSDDEMRSS